MFRTPIITQQQKQRFYNIQGARVPLPVCKITLKVYGCRTGQPASFMVGGKKEKKSRLSLWQMPDNLAPDFGCPDEDLVVLNIWRLKGKNSRQTQSFSRQIAKSNRVRSKVFKIISRNLLQK